MNAIKVINMLGPALNFGITSTILEWIDLISLIVEVLAVIIILGSVIFATAIFISQTFVKKLGPDETFINYKHRLGRALLLGLEILVAADVVRTVALEATLQSVIVLGLLVLIRIFLSWSLIVEIEGRWPWQPRLSQTKEKDTSP
ncbi:MAG: DUF1622 domain-containing protein [Anaerolineales bacterium]|jgi:uncharacterized membrane protein